MSDKIAVLIDGENIDPSFAEQIFSYAASLGTLSVREIYGSGIALNAWSDPILKYTIRTNFTLRPNRFKNSSDIALVIGAMEILAASRTAGDNGIAAVLIVSSDSDFSPLAVHLRAEGIDVIGMGEPKNTNPMWPKACTRYVELKEAQPAEKEPAPKSSEGKKQAQAADNSRNQKDKRNEEKKPAPAEPEKKPVPEKAKPAREAKEAPAEEPAAPAQSQPKAKKAAPAEQKIAPSHRARMEIIRKFIEEQIAAHDGRIKSGELFKSLVNLPDYKYDQQRSKRNPLDYLEKQYAAWFSFEAGEKGSSWISVKEAEAAPVEAPPAEIPAEKPVPAEAAPVTEEKDAEPAPAPTLEENLTAAGIPFKDAVRAATILGKCRNLRDVYNRMRGAFGKEDGKTYYESVKTLVQTGVFAFPKQEKTAPKPADKDDLPLTKEEILAMTAEKNGENKPAAEPVKPAESSVPEAEKAESPEEETAEPEAAENDTGALRLTDGPVRFLMEKGITSDRAVRIVTIFSESPNQRVAYNELRKAFGNKGRQYLGMMKEYAGGSEE